MGFLKPNSEDELLHERRSDHAYDLSFELRGNVAPFLEVTLGPGEGLICDRDSILQHGFGLVVKSWPGLGGSRWLVVNSSDKSHESVMLTTREPGYAGSFDLSEFDKRLICRVECLMANGPGVTASYYAKFREIDLSLVLLEGDGWAFLRSRGDVCERKLTPGEKMCVKAQNVVAMTATVDFELIDTMCNVPQGEKQPDFVTLTGPGIVWMQSVSWNDKPRKRAKPRREKEKVREMATGGLAFLRRNGA